MSNQTDIYNLALSYLKLSQRVQSLTEQTPQAGWLNSFWNNSRKTILEQCYWSFATQAMSLPLLLDQTQVTNPSLIVAPGWRYVYAMPANVLKVQAVTSIYGVRDNPNPAYWWSALSSPWGFGGMAINGCRPPWGLVLDQTQTSPGQQIDIVTDQSNAWAICTMDPPNIGIFPETWADCVALDLATKVGGPLSASDRAIERCMKLAGLSLSRALAKNLNDARPDQYPQSPSIEGRL